jgi:hypothetical protein
LSGLRIKVTAFIAIAVIIASVIIPTPVSADGGPMVDPLLFAQLQEGQQVAVIRLQDNNMTSVDLFAKIHHLIERALISMISFNYKSKENGLGSNI